MNQLPLDYTRCSSDSCILRAKCLRWTAPPPPRGKWASWTDLTDECEKAEGGNYFILDERKGEIE
jgi:hypothetical protein